MALKRTRIVEHAPTLVFAVILGIQLFIPPSVGLANNNDFPKVIGIFDLGTPPGDEYGYADLKYRFDSRYSYNSGYYSSETLLAQLIWMRRRRSGFGSMSRRLSEGWDSGLPNCVARPRRHGKQLFAMRIRSNVRKKS